MGNESETPLVPTNEDVRALCERLASILGTPEPGLATWCGARNRTAADLYRALDAVLPEGLK